MCKTVLKVLINFCSNFVRVLSMATSPLVSWQLTSSIIMVTCMVGTSVVPCVDVF
jgi:hypothetical protein